MVQSDNQQIDTTRNNGHVRNQDDIERRAAELTGLPKDTIKTSVNGVWDAVCEALEDGDSVKFHGKGQYYLSKRSERKGRNPSTGEEYTVPAREAMAFKVSPAYAKRLASIRRERSL